MDPFAWLCQHRGSTEATEDLLFKAVHVKKVNLIFDDRIRVRLHLIGSPGGARKKCMPLMLLSFACSLPLVVASI